MQNSFYVTTQDDKNRTHQFRLSGQDTAPTDHEIVDVRVAGTFRLSSLLSPASLAAIKSVRRTR